MNTNTDKKAPDYGEPWKVENTETELWVSVTNWTRYLGDIACEMGSNKHFSLQHWPARAQRIVQCVNACAGMTDPAAEFAAMREAIKEAHAALKNACAYPVCGSWNEQAEVALAKLQPFIK